MFDQAIHRKLDEVLERLARIELLVLKGNLTIMSELTDLQTEVANTTSAEDSAIALLQGLKSALDKAIAANANGDPTKLAALSSELGAKRAALAAAVVANTPAAAPAPPVPVAPPAAPTSP